MVTVASNQMGQTNSTPVRTTSSRTAAQSGGDPPPVALELKEVNALPQSEKVNRAIEVLVDQVLKEILRSGNGLDAQGVSRLSGGALDTSA
ncbi:MAG: hypothetical protein HQL56_12795 [Magnetococcales bacterium]|nr:hypothetical protein [Magnetococcales bacterium]